MFPLMILPSLLRSGAFLFGIAYVGMKTVLNTPSFFEAICFFASIFSTFLWIQAYFTTTSAIQRYFYPMAAAAAPA